MILREASDKLQILCNLGYSEYELHILEANKHIPVVDIKIDHDHKSENSIIDIITLGC